MRILKCPDIGKRYFQGSAVTIGNFDGVHRGHAGLFRQLKVNGERLGLPTIAVTFEPHPLVVLSPGSAPPQITTFSQKTALIERAGIDCLAVIEFTPEFSRIPADAFVRTLLCHAFGMRHIIIGHDYAFGRDRQGNFETLAGMATECGFSIEDLDPIGDGSAIYSSSLVRRLIAGGDMPGAASILGRYHVVSGQVVHGREIGARLGFPTANIAADNELIPPDGVYAVMVSVGGRLVQGACSIGSNPTFNNDRRSIEVYLLDFNEQLYGTAVEVFFVLRLRDVNTFPDTETLIQAITNDVAQTRAILAEIDLTLVKPLTHKSERGLM